MLIERVYAAHRRLRMVVSGSTLVSLGVHAAALVGVAAFTGAQAAQVVSALSEGIIFFAPPPTAAAGP